MVLAREETTLDTKVRNFLVRQQAYIYPHPSHESYILELPESKETCGIESPKAAGERDRSLGHLFDGNQNKG